jgi:hypothetical protein
MLSRRAPFQGGALLITACVACGPASEHDPKPAPPIVNIASATTKRATPSSSTTSPPVASGASASTPFERADCRSPKAKLYYFPEGSLVPKEVSASADLLIRESRTPILAKMSEPSLSCAKPARDSLRLLITPTWGGPLAIRVEGGALSLVILDGEAGYYAGEVVQRFKRRLTAAEQRSFAAALAKAEFWTTPPNNFDEMGNDGTTWMIEGRARSKYRVVQRWQPKSSSFRELAVLMLGFAGCDPEQSPRQKRTVPHCRPAARH